MHPSLATAGTDAPKLTNVHNVQLYATAFRIRMSPHFFDALQKITFESENPWVISLVSLPLFGFGGIFLEFFGFESFYVDFFLRIRVASEGIRSTAFRQSSPPAPAVRRTSAPAGA